MGKEETIFDKIIRKEIPATIVYEDDLCIAFKDITPVAPVHVLLIPKKRGNLDRLSHATEEDEKILGHLMVKVSQVAKQLGLSTNGFRIVINDGQQGGQSVNHLHIHIIGGAQMYWPPGTQKNDEL